MMMGGGDDKGGKKDAKQEDDPMASMVIAVRYRGVSNRRTTPWPTW